MGTISVADASRDLKQRIERPTDVWGWERLVAEKEAEIEQLRAALLDAPVESETWPWRKKHAETLRSISAWVPGDDEQTTTGGSREQG